MPRNFFREWTDLDITDHADVVAAHQMTPRALACVPAARLTELLGVAEGTAWLLKDFAAKWVDKEAGKKRAL